MATINTDLSSQYQWLIRQGAHNTFTVTFTNSAVAFDISSYVFTLSIRPIGSSTNSLQLTQGAGITNSGATGILTIDITSTQSTALSGSYFYEITYVKSTKTFGLIHGTADVIKTYNSASATSSLSLSVSLAGTNISAAITLAGSSGGGAWGEIEGTLSDQTDLNTALNAIAQDIDDHEARTDNPHSVTKAQVGLGNVQNVDQTNPANITQDSTHRFATDTEKSTWNGKQNALGYTAEDSANKSTSVTTDLASNTKYPSVKAVYDWVVSVLQTWVWTFATTVTGTTDTINTARAGNKIRYNSATDVTVTIPTNATDPIPIGSRYVLRQSGAGKVIVSPAVGVTINTPDATLLSTQKQYSEIYLVKAATDTWELLVEASSYWEWIKTQTQTISGFFTFGKVKATHFAPAFTVLTDAANISWNGDVAGNHTRVTLGGNRTLMQ
jgi:hypothetical protein